MARCAVRGWCGWPRKRQAREWRRPVRQYARGHTVGERRGTGCAAAGPTAASPAATGTGAAASATSAGAAGAAPTGSAAPAAGAAGPAAGAGPAGAAAAAGSQAAQAAARLAAGAMTDRGPARRQLTIRPARRPAPPGHYPRHLDLGTKQMTHDQVQARSYGGWRRSRSIGLLGLGPTATLVLLGCAVGLLLVAAVSLKALLFAAPPALLAGAASLVRVGGIPLAQLGVQRLRWWRGTTGGYTSYRAEVVLRHTGVLQLPGALAATELLSAEDGCGGRYGLVRDRHTGLLTVTLRVVPASTWLAEPGDADGWVANWGGWLASLGYLPALRWVSVTVDTAPDPGSTLTGQVAAAIDPAAPRAALQSWTRSWLPPQRRQPTWTRGSASPSTPPPSPRHRAPSPRRSPRQGARCSAWSRRSARAASPCSAAPRRRRSPGLCAWRSIRRSAARSTGSWLSGWAPRWRSS